MPSRTSTRVGNAEEVYVTPHYALATCVQSQRNRGLFGMASGMIIAGFFIRACMSVLCSHIQGGLRASVYPRQYLLQGREELLPSALGALVGLLLIRPEARLLHAQVGPRARRGERPRDDALETKGGPRVGQR